MKVASSFQQSAQISNREVIWTTASPIFDTCHTCACNSTLANVCVLTIHNNTFIPVAAVVKESQSPATSHQWMFIKKCKWWCSEKWHLFDFFCKGFSCFLFIIYSELFFISFSYRIDNCFVQAHSGIFIERSQGLLFCPMDETNNAWFVCVVLVKIDLVTAYSYET